jgi:RNA polymerase sigma-32 factor
MRYIRRTMTTRRGEGKRSPGRPRKGAGPAKTDGDETKPEAVEAELVDEESGEEQSQEEAEPEAGELEEVEVTSEIPEVEAKDNTRAERSIARHDPLAAYVAEIKRIPLLTREEEHDLAVKFHESGDLDVAKRLINANLRLVVKIAHEYRRAYKNLLDLVQEGNIGLMQAVKKYDPFRGVKLSSYAAWWIRAYILKFILNNWRLVKIGTTQAQRKLFFNLRKEKEKLEQLGFAPEHKLLAERLNVSEEDVREMDKRLSGGDVSLDAPATPGEDNGRTRLDELPSGSDTRPDVRAEENEFRQQLRAKLEEFAAGLDGREATLFRDRWLTETPKTLQEVGDGFGITRERARQIERRLLDRLRLFLEEELGTAVDIAGKMEE